MARFERYANSDDTYSYIVESDKGTDRKYFSENKDEKAEEKARSYYLYLQQLDAQRRNVEQNDQIIAGQRKGSSRPQRNVQELDPEYAEWLRFKKATDPAFIKWKEEEERKKKEQQKIEEEKQKELQRKQEAEWKKRQEAECRQKLLEFQNKVSLLEQHIEIWAEIISDVKRLYNTRCKASERFYAKPPRTSEGEFYQFGLRDDEYRASNSNLLAIDINAARVICEKLKRLVSRANISTDLVNYFYSFESEFNSEMSKIVLGDVRKLNKYISDIILMEAKVSQFRGSGIFEAAKVSGIRSKYLRDNSVYCSIAKSIKSKLDALQTKYPSIPIRHFSNVYVAFPYISSINHC